MSISSRQAAVLSSTAVLLGVVLLLNVPLAVYIWAPVSRPAFAFLPIVESILFLWLTVAVTLFARKSLSQRVATIVSGALLGVLLGFSAAEAFFQFYFARSFMPRGDIGMIRGALLLFLGDIGPLVDLLTPVVTVVLFILLSLFGIACFTALRFFAGFSRRPVSAAVILTVLSVIVMFIVGMPQSITARTVVGLGRDAEAGFRSVRTAPVPDVRTPSLRDRVPDYTFPGLKDRDIYFFAVEAYGHASVVRPHLADKIDPYRDRFAQALSELGYGVVSSFLESPVAGGYSWLAEATLFTGQWINSQERFLELYDAGLPSLSGFLHEGGYYTFTIRPGTVHGAWPEGWDLYRFRESLIAFNDGFGFRGPWFSYVPVTDQFALWTGERRVRELIAPGGEAATRPLFAYYQLVSSHTPFNRIPPIIRPWELLGDGSIYLERESEVQTFRNSWTGGTELEEGYVTAIGYVFSVLTEYVSDIMEDDRDPILVVYGDHQPQRPLRSPQAHLSVPIHVASRDPDVLTLFREHGFVPGMVSNEPPPHRKMDEFFTMLSEIAATRIEGRAFTR